MPPAPRRHTANFAAIPEVIGTHWFQYYDHPKGGRPDGEDYDFGLVDTNDRPYERVDRGAGRGQPASAAHPRRSAVYPPAAESRPIPTRRSRWPTARCPMAEAAEPAAAAATIAGRGRFRRNLPVVERARARPGDDRPGLLRHRPVGYDGAFPLAESYRVEIGVDLGAGPRRFTLFFIPPRDQGQRPPEMKRPALRRGRGGGDPRLAASLPAPGGLFRRRPAAHHRGDDDPLVGARHRAAARRGSRRNRDDLLASRALDVALRASRPKPPSPTPPAGTSSGSATASSAIRPRHGSRAESPSTFVMAGLDPWALDHGLDPWASSQRQQRFGC